MLHPDREGRFTASSHAIALGHGYDSPQAYWRVWNGMETKEVSPLMVYGSEHEDDAIAEYEVLTGDIVTSKQEWVAWEHWSGATLDGRTQYGVLECKAPQKQYDSPPVKHWIQCQSQMVFADEGFADLCSWTPEECRIWRTKKDGEYWTLVAPILESFYACLTSGMEPRRGQFKKVALTPQWERIA